MSNDYPESTGEDEHVTFSRTEWTREPRSIAFGMPKVPPRIKPKVDGMKAILVETEIFVDLKVKTQGITRIMPRIDVAEVINAALLLTAEDEALWSRVIARLIEYRAEQASKLRERLTTTNTLPPEPNEEREL
jgi:hypothetical protein